MKIIFTEIIRLLLDSSTNINNKRSTNTQLNVYEAWPQRCGRFIKLRYLISKDLDLDFFSIPHQRFLCL